MNHTPVAVGLVLCDLVIVDEKTRNVTPVNCFGARRFRDFPAIAEFYVVAWLADGLGELPVDLIVEKLDTLDEVFRQESRLQFDDPLTTKYLIVRIRDCTFPVPGSYVVSLNVAGELVAHRRFRVYK